MLKIAIKTIIVLYTLFLLMLNQEVTQADFWGTASDIHFFIDIIFSKAVLGLFAEFPLVSFLGFLFIISDIKIIKS
jgi:hypothetical protein